jgi:hypothetical protein
LARRAARCWGWWCGQGIWFGIAGMIGGLLMALASTRVLQTLLFGVSPRDGWAYATAGATMLALSVLAALGPALPRRGRIQLRYFDWM